MVARGGDWLGRIVLPLISAALSLCSMAIVVYFSSQRSAIEELGQQVRADSSQVLLLKQSIDFNKARRDEQVSEIEGQLDRLEGRRR